MSAAERRLFHKDSNRGNLGQTVWYLALAFFVSLLIGFCASALLAQWRGSLLTYLGPATGLVLVLFGVLRVVDRTRTERGESEPRVIEAEVRFDQAFRVIDIPIEECEFDELALLRVEGEPDLFVALPCLTRPDPEEWDEKRVRRLEKDYRGWFITSFDCVPTSASVSMLERFVPGVADVAEHVVPGREMFEQIGTLHWSDAVGLGVLFDPSVLVAREYAPERLKRAQIGGGIPGAWYGASQANSLFGPL